MVKNKKVFACVSCGSEFSKWSGKCPLCNEWNSLIEAEKSHSGNSGEKLEIISLSAVKSESTERIKTGLGEFNLVCGGGMVPGSIILVGGEPGIGKSTLALQVAGYVDTLYISGEESPVQIKQRAERLGIDPGRVRISTSTDIDVIVDTLTTGKIKKSFQCIVVDSIQTIQSTNVPGIAGSVSQIRSAAAKLAILAKKLAAPVILIGHITKEGNIAGPKLLEHIVDTVIYFEGDYTKDFRILRAFKNRFGSVNEIGLFRMTPGGLEEVKEKNRVFLNPFLSSSPGNAVSAAIEGSRTILFEVQSLVTFTGFPNPRRMADGLDLNRLILITAVLEKHAGQKLNSFDVFLNVSGGFRINDTAADLAVAMSVTSSLREQPVPDGIGLLGEISLSGEIRPVSQCNRRLMEFKHSGFNTVFISHSDMKDAEKSGFKGNLVGVKDIAGAIDRLF